MLCRRSRYHRVTESPPLVTHATIAITITITVTTAVPRVDTVRADHFHYETITRIRRGAGRARDAEVVPLPAHRYRGG